MLRAASASVLVRIFLAGIGAVSVAALGAVVLAASPAPTSGGGSSGDPHAHHHPDAAPPAEAPPSTGSAPAHSSAISTPSWFAGGDSLYVPAFFDTFKGLDLSGLTAGQKERFLHRVNTEFCSCNQTGCHRDTIAHCYVTDTACPRAPVRIREILEKVKAEGKDATSAPPTPAISITPRP